MESIRLPDGRTAQLWLGGADTGPTVLFFHGCPDTRHAAMTGHDAARAAGVRLLCVNRPGYGLSTPHPSSHASVAADAMAALDEVGAEAVAVIGMSIGGPYALATAALHPDRVTSMAVVSSISNLPERWLPGALDEVVERCRPDFAAWVAGIDPADPDDPSLVARFVASLPDADAALLVARPVTDVAASVREALVRPDGFLRDAAICLREWDFSPAAVSCPTTIVHGEHDTAHPLVHGRTLADQVPGARLVVRPTTHLATLLTGWPEILASLDS
ncbi:MAG: alpha/beta fold hydrolase [Actinobacteria bacterium]|uniref:Unannotated protein n=1 Tax=freshwater metagenome TaxID=449393 RepID=A0A6J6QM28_9ZZZZ|nr:alpha/beta fold hydrolase [Actinomycetota bacterium]